MRMKNIKNSFLVLLGLCLFQCSSDKKEGPTDSATIGEITLGVDESFEPLMKAEKTAFEEQYHYAKINYKFSSRRAGDSYALVTSNQVAKDILEWVPIKNLANILEDANAELIANN